MDFLSVMAMAVSYSGKVSIDMTYYILLLQILKGSIQVFYTNPTSVLLI